MSKFTIYQKPPFSLQDITPPPVIMSNDKLGELVFDTIIEQNGINSPIFGVVGAAWYTLDEILQKYINEQKINYIHASNESAGCYMAAYMAEAIGKVGVAITTAGPGTAMAITAISSIYNEEKPLVCFCGVPTNDFQYISPVVMNHITKATLYIDSTTPNAKSVLEQAFLIAKIGTKNDPGPGPVVIFVRVNMWESSYMVNPVIPYSYSQPNMYNLMNNINNSLFNKKILLRIGSRVSKENLQRLANMSLQKPNVAINVTFAAKNLVDFSAYPNLGVEGPLGNSVINSRYSDADIIIECGIGIAYTLLTYYDINHIKYPLKASAKVFTILDEVPTNTPPVNANRTIFYCDVDYFIDNLMAYFNYNPQVSWDNIQSQKLAEQTTTLENYKNQKIGTIYSSASVIAQVLGKIYDINGTPYIRDSVLYACDIGASSFIAEQMIYHATPGNLITFDQYSPIGCSSAAAAGKMLIDNYTDLVLFMGDGGFLNVPGYLIDLTNVLKEKNKRALIVFSNDNHYSNVAIGEIAAFGYTTSITSTAPIQAHINMFNLLDSLSGGNVQNLILSNLQTSSSLVDTFVDNWYRKASGFTQSGMYIIYHENSVIPAYVMDH